MNSNTPKKNKTVLLCVGNELRGDDAFGPLLYQKMKAFESETFLVLDGGEVPEALSGVIKRFAPDMLILADAAAFGGYHGEVRVLSTEEISNASFSTHGLPLSMLIKFLEVECVFIAAQIKSTTLGAPPSKEILHAVSAAEELVLKINNSLK